MTHHGSGAAFKRSSQREPAIPKASAVLHPHVHLDLCELEGRFILPYASLHVHVL